jgi:all-trans-retinol 13,14-reductase
MKKYDAVIIGSGMGGLACGTILAKEGYSVCVIEKNKQIGGTLQTYARDKVIFDSGVHYVGGLEKGQNLYQLFKYLGIMDKLKMRKLDADTFDAVAFADDPKIYRYAQGYDRFMKVMLEDFPDEEPAITKYCDAIKEACSKFPLYNLRSGSLSEKLDALETDTKTFIESITSNKKLQNVLGGTNLLYAGQADKTPFYVHALVINSYLESSYRFVDGGSQIARLLSKEITSRGGVILRDTKVVKIVEENRLVQYVELQDGEKVYADKFISNIHPQKTLEITESDMIKKVYRNRIKSLENSVSTFCVNVVMKKDTFKYLNYNFYCFTEDDPWSAIKYTDENWPNGYALFFTASSRSKEYAEGVTIMAYMRFEDVKQWADTFNTVSEEDNRGEDYDKFKIERTEKLFNDVEKRFPDFRNCIKSYYVATPLTWRDYIGTDDGSLYGIVKDYREPLKTFISPRTKIPNLYLTGQNLNMHGLLGVTVGAVVTCSDIFGTDYLLEKINNA